MIVTEYEIGRAKISVYRPVLSDEEREQREKQILTALQLVGRSVAKTRRDTNGDNDQTRDNTKE